MDLRSHCPVYQWVSVTFMTFILFLLGQKAILKLSFMNLCVCVFVCVMTATPFLPL